jgi:hypothetical protein
MSKQNTRSTKRSLGLISDREIEMWNSDSKRRSNMNSTFKESRNHKRKDSEVNNEEEFSIIFDTSLNQLREKTQT